MMVKWANDDLLQANDGKMLVNDGEMLVNDGEMSAWSITHFTIITSISPSLTSIFPSLARSKPSFAHLTIIAKLHRLLYQAYIFAFVHFPKEIWFFTVIFSTVGTVRSATIKTGRCATRSQILRVALLEVPKWYLQIFSIILRWKGYCIIRKLQRIIPLNLTEV